MDEKPELIRHQIEETRTALAGKLETLEREVRGTVHDAREAVTCTVETVREAVSSTADLVRDTVTDTVEGVRGKLHDAAYTVKENLNIEHQVQAHPWAMLGGSVVAGYVLGSVLPGQGGTRTRHGWPAGSTSYPEHIEEAPPSRSVMQSVASSVPSTMAEAGHKAAGFINNIVEEFAPEIEKVKGLAIGTAIGLVRDMLKSQVPEHMVSDFEDIVNRVTTKLGGKPVEGPVMPSFESGSPYRERRSYAATDVSRSREDFGERRFDR